MKKPKPKQRKIPKPRPGLRCQFIEASLLNGEKLEFCEQQCGRAATWDVVYTYDPTVLSDNGGKRSQCTVLLSVHKAVKWTLPEEWR